MQYIRIQKKGLYFRTPYYTLFPSLRIRERVILLEKKVREYPAKMKREMKQVPWDPLRKGKKVNECVDWNESVCVCVHLWVERKKGKGNEKALKI